MDKWKYWELLGVTLVGLCLAAMVLLSSCNSRVLQVMEPVTDMCYPTCEALYDSCVLATHELDGQSTWIVATAKVACDFGRLYCGIGCDEVGDMVATKGTALHGCIVNFRAGYDKIYEDAGPEAQSEMVNIRP